MPQFQSLRQIRAQGPAQGPAVAGTGATVMIEGFEELSNALRRLPGVVREKILQKDLNKGAKLIAETARTRVPVSRAGPLFGRGEHHPGRLRDAIKSGKHPEEEHDAIKSWTFVKIGRKRSDITGAYYAWMVELGHKVVIPKSPGRGGGRTSQFFTKGRVPAKSYMRNSADSEKFNVISVIERGLKKDVVKEAAKLVRQG